MRRITSQNPLATADTLCLHKTMLFLSAALCLLLFPPGASGGNPPGLIPGKMDDDSFLSLTLTMPAYDIIRAEKGMTRIKVDDFGFLNSPGDPRLPQAIYTLAIPPDADVESVHLKVLNMQTEPLDGEYDIEAGYPLAAYSEGGELVSWGDGKIIKGTKNALVYESDNPYPAKPVEILSITRLKKWKLVRLTYYPFCYYPKSKKVELIKRIDLEIRFKRTGQKGSVYRETAVDRAGRSIIGNISQVAHLYSSPGILSTDDIQHDYVIITTNVIRDNSVRLDDFIALKESFGHSVLIVTQDDYDTLTGQSPNGVPEKIREWLKTNYQAMGIAYVLLAGNPHPSKGDIPMKMCCPRCNESSHKEAPSDYFYADLTGNWDLDEDGNFGEYNDDSGVNGVEFDAEVWVGRIPVYNNDYDTLDSILQKIIDYQTKTGDMSWRKKVLLPMAIANYAGEPEYNYPDGDYPLTDSAKLAQHMISDLDYLSDNGFTAYTLYEKAGDVPSAYSCDAPLTQDNVTSEWAGGRYGLVCWWGHGSQIGAYRRYWVGETKHNPSFFVKYDTSVLGNTFPSLVYHCSCYNGYPENSSNLGYALLKLGAVGTVSAARLSWYRVGWDVPDSNRADNASLGYYYMKKLVNETSCGQALAACKGALTDGGAEMWMNLQEFNLYGDPSLTLVNPEPLCPSDLDQDGDVDGSDLASLAADYNASCLGAFATAFGRIDFQ